MADGTYTTAEVAEITGFTKRQLDHWDRQGMLTPSAQQAHGSGSRRLYAFSDLVQLRFVRHLKDQRWSTQKIQAAITQLRDVMNDPDPRKKAVLFDGKGTILALCKTKDRDPVIIDALSAGGQQVMEIVLEVLEDEARHIMTIFGARSNAEEAEIASSIRDESKKYQTDRARQTAGWDGTRRTRTAAEIMQAHTAAMKGEER